MTHRTVARALLAILCGLQGLATPAIDLIRTHATNPLWPGHARFHLVWQTFNSVWLALIEIVLIVAAGPMQAQRFYLAAILAGIPMLGFFLAFAARGLYRGTLSDPNGIPPLTIMVKGSAIRFDLSVATEIGALLSLAAIIVIFRCSAGSH